MKTEQRVIKFQSIHRHFKTGEICFDEWGPDERGGFKAPAYIHGYSQIGNRQFTGLVDKEGNEIYEGDKVKWRHPADNGYREGIINYNQEEGAFLINDRFYMSEAEVFEIIGNIYQHPQLLPSTTTI